MGTTLKRRPNHDMCSTTRQHLLCISQIDKPSRMGRLPKGFKKTLQHKEPDEEQAPAPPAAPPAAAASSSKATAKKDEPALNPAFLKDEKQAQPAASKGAPPQPAQSAFQPDASDGSGSEDEGNGVETRGHVIQRHKKEMQAFKKNLPRLGKKSKDEIAKLTAELEAKHAKELAAFDSKPSEPAQDTARESVQEGVEKLVLGGAGAGGEAGAGHKTKAMKRREKLAAAEAEREARIAEEAAAAGPSARAAEEAALHELLTPLGLRMREIRADGHCLYRSLEDQLTLDKAQVLDVQALRSAAAAHMRQHPDQFLHFVDHEDGDTPEQAFDKYCTELESTAAWGGQLELSVLSQVLKRTIKVYAVGLPPLTLGEEHTDKAPLQVCYLRHAFGLGEHYNSLEPLPAA